MFLNSSIIKFKKKKRPTLLIGLALVVAGICIAQGYSWWKQCRGTRTKELICELQTSTLYSNYEEQKIDQATLQKHASRYSDDDVKILLSFLKSMNSDIAYNAALILGGKPNSIILSLIPLLNGGTEQSISAVKLALVQLRPNAHTATSPQILRILDDNIKLLVDQGKKMDCSYDTGVLLGTMPVRFLREAHDSIKLLAETVPGLTEPMVQSVVTKLTERDMPVDVDIYREDEGKLVVKPVKPSLKEKCRSLIEQPPATIVISILRILQPNEKKPFCMNHPIRDIHPQMANKINEICKEGSSSEHSTH